MRSRLSLLSVAAALALTACQAGDDIETVGPASAPDAEVFVRSAEGVPTFVGGDLGHIPDAFDPDDAAAQMAPVLAQVAPLFGTRAVDLRFDAIETDDIGYQHLHYQQEVNGLEVVGGQLDLHIDHRGVVYLANGAARDIAIPATPTTSLVEATARLVANRSYRSLTLGDGHLVYLIATRDDRPYLTWEIVARGMRDGDPVRDLVYMDARGGSLVEVHPTIAHRAARLQRVPIVGNLRPRVAQEFREPRPLDLSDLLGRTLDSPDEGELPGDAAAGGLQQSENGRLAQIHGILGPRAPGMGLVPDGRHSMGMACVLLPSPTTCGRLHPPRAVGA